MTDRAGKPGRRKAFTEIINVLFREGTKAAIDKVLYEPLETRAEFIRTAVQSEIDRRIKQDKTRHK